MKFRSRYLVILCLLFPTMLLALTEGEVIRTRRVLFSENGGKYQLRKFGYNEMTLGCGDCHLQLVGNQIFRILFERIDEFGKRRGARFNLLPSCEASHDAIVNHFIRGVSRPGVGGENIEDCFNQETIAYMKKYGIKIAGVDLAGGGKLPIMKGDEQIGYFQNGQANYHPITCFDSANNCKQQRYNGNASMYSGETTFSSLRVDRLLGDQVTESQICALPLQRTNMQRECRNRARLEAEEIDLNNRCKWIEQKYIESSSRCLNSGRCIGIVECQNSYRSASCAGTCSDKLSPYCSFSEM